MPICCYYTTTALSYNSAQQGGEGPEDDVYMKKGVNVETQDEVKRASFKGADLKQRTEPLCSVLDDLIGEVELGGGVEVIK
jgi:hypothetical protein